MINLADILRSENAEIIFKPRILASWIPRGEINFKPRILASWIPRGEINFKPRILASWIPRGEINFKPLILASIVPAPTKIAADLYRRVSATELPLADTERKIKRSENIVADTARTLVKTEKIFADSKREVSDSEKISADLALNLIASSTARADTFRELKSFEKKIADTAIKIGIVSIHADTKRQVKSRTEIFSDLCRKIGCSENFFADTERNLLVTEKIPIATERNVQASEKIRAYTEKKIGIKEKISADTYFTLASHEKISCDTCLSVRTLEKITAELKRQIREHFRADTQRKISAKERVFADTITRIPHILNYTFQSTPRTFNVMTKAKIFSLDETSPPISADPKQETLIETFKQYNVTNFNISLKQKTLSDELFFTSVNYTWVLNSAVKGKLLDYPFNFLVEEIVESAPFSTSDIIPKTQNCLTQEIRCKYNLDELLYSWFDFEFNEQKASKIIADLANELDLKPKILISDGFDFTPTNLTSGKITYADLLSSLFGWTSQVPTKQINVYIRDDTLYCVQRGEEDPTNKRVDLNSLPYANPRTKKTLYRVLCNNPNLDNNSESDDNDYDDPEKFFSGILSYKSADFSVHLTYSNGFLISELTKLKNSEHETESSTTYEYESFSSADEKNYNQYLALKSQKNTNTQYENGVPSEKSETITQTEYHYQKSKSEVWLVAEYEKNTVTNYSRNENSVTKWDADQSEVHIRHTNHLPVGNGWYGQVVFLDGELQGANISEGKPGNAVSPYTVAQFQDSFSSLKTVSVQELPNADTEETNTDDGLSVINQGDDIFPIKELEVITKWKEQQKNLNNSILHEITCELVSKIDRGVPEFKSIVDFDNYIVLNDQQVYLESNTISFTSRKLIQKLQLTKWEQI